MALAGFQSSLGSLVRGAHLASAPLSVRELACLDVLRRSPGLDFTMKVQRSWCAGRASKAAHFTLSILSEERRQALLDAWVEMGGGTTSFVGAEAAAFLSFVAGRLANPSHERSVCDFERAALRVAEGVPCFRPPDVSAMNEQAQLRRGRYAALVTFMGDPNLVLEALARRKELALSATGTALILGPGLIGLYRLADRDDSSLFERLDHPSTIAQLLKQGWRGELLADWLQAGLMEFA